MLDNLGLVWVAIEGATAVSTLLVGFYRTPRALEAAWKYLILGSVGIGFALLGTVLVYASSVGVLGETSDALNWSRLMASATGLDPGLLRLGFLFVLVGYGTKIGLAPFHTWLPDAHSQAPSPISALLSGVSLAVALYVLVRFHLVAQAALGPSFSAVLLVGFGLLSLAVALPFLVAQGDLKRLLAYSSIEHMGLLTLAIGFGGRLALLGATLHVLAHALSKATAFLAAGEVIQQYGSPRLGRLRGTLAMAPDAGPGLLVAAIVAGGMPPSAVFVAEIAIIFGGVRGWLACPCRLRGGSARPCIRGTVVPRSPRCLGPTWPAGAERLAVGGAGKPAAGSAGRGAWSSGSGRRPHWQRSSTPSLPSSVVPVPELGDEVPRPNPADLWAVTAGGSSDPGDVQSASGAWLPDPELGSLLGDGRPLASVAPDERAWAVDASRLASIAAGLGAAGWSLATLVGTDDRHLGGGFGVELVMHRPEAPILRLRAALPAAAPAYPSVGRALPAALWDERELKDLFGIVPEGHPDPRRLVLHDAYPPGFHPLRRDSPAEVPDLPAQRHFVPFAAHGEGVYQLPVGPIHAGVIEPGHFRFSAVGESILHLDARLFFTHRGVEKLVEGRTFGMALEIVQRSCGVCTVTHAIAYCHALERLAGTELPPRAASLRAILAELERLYNHVGDLGNICAGVGFNVGSSQLAWLKERLLRVNEAMTGHRYLTGAVAPGGLAIAPQDVVLDALGGRLAEIETDLLAILRLVNRADAVLERFRGTGRLASDVARRLGTVGVAARASGLPIDLRRDRPSGAYRELAVPLVESASGDVAARFHVRAQEAIASFGLLRALLAGLPAGPVHAELGSIEPGTSALGWAEGPRGASWIWLRAGCEGTVDRLRLRSASFANWTAVAAVAPGNLVPDFPLINKSFELCYACTDR